MIQKPVYLDYNATTPCDPEVLERMLPYFSRHFGNAASRNHAFGWVAEEAVSQAREQIASLIHAEPSEIYFTSGATESVNLALKGLYEMYGTNRSHIITVSTEHQAVLDTCRHLEKLGARISYLSVDAEGLIDLDELDSLITDQTLVIAIMYANNETGVIQPVEEIGRIAKKRNLFFFSDATQALGKVPVDVNRDGIDLMAINAHKLYGPKGIGGIFLRRRSPRVRIYPQMDGGGHEKGIRSGTLNIPGIVGFGKACELAGQMDTKQVTSLRELRDRLESGILDLAGGATINGKNAPRLSNTSNICFSGSEVRDDGMLSALSKSVAVSSGSACSSASQHPSHVLKAMGLTDREAYASIRFSVGRFSYIEEIDFAIEQVGKVLEGLRKVRIN
jgi:cysteine desulfurase